MRASTRDVRLPPDGLIAVLVFSKLRAISQLAESWIASRVHVRSGCVPEPATFAERLHCDMEMLAANGKLLDAIQLYLVSAAGDFWDGNFTGG